MKRNNSQIHENHCSAALNKANNSYKKQQRNDKKKMSKRRVCSRVVTILQI
jgi:hypothetical protein